jgi:hypothetical protein
MPGVRLRPQIAPHFKWKGLGIQEPAQSVRLIPGRKMPSPYS